MGKISINSFEKGMNLDSSKVVQAKNTAYSLTNFRPWTDNSGKAVGGLLNIRGNELSFTLPETTPTYEFITSYPDSNTGTEGLLFEVDTSSYNMTIDVAGADNIEITAKIVTQINNDPSVQALGVEAYLTLPNLIRFRSITQDVFFDVSDGSSYMAKGVYLPAQTDLEIIGWTTVRDDFYLFTTNDTTTSGGPGQIWKLEVDEVTQATALSIVYNDYVNFSREYPIEAIGRYENDCTKRLYWTDNYNVVRTIQTESPNVFFTDVENLGLIPILNHSQPVLENILTGGNLTTGIYQVAYRLRTAAGSETSFSLPSRMIPIVSADEETANYWEYLGENSGSNSGKGIEINVSNLDQDYDFIEIVTLYRASKNSTAVVTSVATEPYEGGVFRFTIDGQEQNSFEISLDEFLIGSRAFTHAKTLTSKDNRLFVANTSYAGLDFTIDEFDPRAYGHEINSTTFNVDGNAYTNFSNVPDEANAINDDFSVNKFYRGTSEYGGSGEWISYKIKTKQVLADTYPLDTTTNDSGVTFESLPIRLADVNSFQTLDLNEGRVYEQNILFSSMKSPYRFGVQKGYQRDEIYRFAIVFFDQQGNAGFANWIADIKIPEAFDPGRSAYSDTGSNYNNVGFRGNLLEGGFPYYYNVPYIEFEVDLPQSVKDQVTGYSIVRMEREANDRTVVAQGLAFKTGPYIKVDASPPNTIATPTGEMEDGNEYLFSLAQGEIDSYGASNNDYDPELQNVENSYDPTGGFDYRSNYFTVQFPEHLYTNELSNRAGDKIKTVQTLGDGDQFASDLNDLNFKYEATTQDYSIYIRKMYKMQTPAGLNTYSTNIETDIENFWFIPEGAEGSETEIDNNIIFRNEVYAPYRTTGIGSSQSAKYHGWGQKTVLIKTVDPIYSNTQSYLSTPTFAGTEITLSPGTDTGGLNGATLGANHYIVNYKRDLLAQYGGNTFNQRSNNSYISTGNFIQVDDAYTSRVFDVTGGDIFMTLMDVHKATKSWAFSNSSATPRRSQTLFFPVESPIHTEMRQGIHMQSHLVAETGTRSDTSRGNVILTGNTDLGETFTYNNVYSAEDNIVKFFAKPFDFKDSDCIDYFDTRIYASDPKINGEVIDSWQSFGANEFIDLESLYGPINKVYTLNDQFYSFQDRATCIVSINPRVQTTTSDGQSLELGVGGVLHDYTYASNSVGCKHQWGVIPSKSHLYWVDINNNKMYRIGADGMAPLSDYKGSFSYLDDNLINDIRLNELDGGDNPLIGKGINGYYDYKYNEVVFTVQGAIVPPYLSELDLTTNYVPGQLVNSPLGSFEVLLPFSYPGKLTIEQLIVGGFLREIHSAPTGFTIVFNEFIQGFSSFYTFESPLYFYDPSTLFSVDSKNRTDSWIHDKGPRGSFYGFVNDSEIHMYANDMPVYTKVFDNLIWHTESTNINGEDQPNDTFYELKCETTYQETDYINLINNNTVKRKERTWQAHVPRSNTNRERMRDKHMEIKFKYDNNPDNRFLVHMIGHSYRPSFR